MMLQTLLIAPFAAVCQGSPLPDFPFVSVSGHAEAKMAPDIVTVSFTVRAQDQDPAKALAMVEDRSKQLFRLFSELKVHREDIVADEIGKELVTEKDLSPELQGERRFKALGYEITRPFSVTLRDLQAFDRLMTGLLRMEGVVEIASRFDRTDRKKIEDELTEKASQDAKEQAIRLAKGFGVELGPVFALSKRGFSSLGDDLAVSGVEDFGYGAAKTARTPEKLFVPSTITIETNVKAIFKLRTETK